MKSYKIVMGLCLLFLLGTAIYFLATQGYTEANFDTSKGPEKGDRITGLGILYFFFCIAGLFVALLREERKNKSTRYRK